jgi:hypothetical protein
MFNLLSDGFALLIRSGILPFTSHSIAILSAELPKNKKRPVQMNKPNV